MSNGKPGFFTSVQNAVQKPFTAQGVERRINHAVGAAAIAYGKPGGSYSGAAKEALRGAFSPKTGLSGHLEHTVGAGVRGYYGF